MPDDPPHKDVFYDILRVLERIEAKLDGHEERFRQLEHPPALSKYTAHKEEEERTSDTLAGSLVSTRPDNAVSSESETPDEIKPGPKIPYGDWSIDQFIRSLPEDVYSEWGTSNTHLERFYRMTDLSLELTKRLGSCWEMPDDTRFPLKFFKSNVLKMYVTGAGPNTDTFSKAKQKIEKDMGRLCDFDDILRANPGNDFVVCDFDPANNSRMYRLGQEAIGPELMIDPSDAQNAPWSRLILYQGATTGGSIATDKKRPEQPIPYFTRTDRIVGVWDHLSFHLRLKNRSITTNPYFSRWTGFHTTFYEIVDSTVMRQPELWKHGPLYDHPLGWNFRKCAFTLYAPASSDMGFLGADQPHHPMPPARHWTLLVLAPNKFFNEHSVLFPSKTAEFGFNTTQITEDPLGKLTQAGAELKFIGQGLEKISDRWADFQVYFDYMLDGGNSLMHPAEHDNLLFDDGAFSRSRKYFWAIDCLSEFEASITDNLMQWEQYRLARIDPIAHFLPQLDRRLLFHIERQHQILQNQRDSFRQKLVAIRALRDALFNASAVIESRASTRLGENVKLLTFVSIFFLPLSFVTSLWSINDTFPRTTLIYVIILVAVFTYLTMFNINTLAEGFGEIYGLRKKRIIRAMKSDYSEAWKERGRRFEVFRPKHENPEPSEWLIPLYVISHPGILFGISGGGDSDNTQSSGSVQKSGMLGIFRRRRTLKKEIGRTDEGWVL